jgi:hypothetical protein
MPKLSPIQKLSRIQEVIEQLERGEEVEAKKNKALLDGGHLKALDDAWAKQQALRKKYKPPKSEEDAERIGWKTQREVRIEIYKKAAATGSANVVDDLKKERQDTEIRAAKIYLEARFTAKDGTDKDSAGKMALVRAGLRIPMPVVAERDMEIRKLEQQILEGFGDDLSVEQREHLEWLKEGKKKVKKAKRG